MVVAMMVTEWRWSAHNPTRPVVPSGVFCMATHPHRLSWLLSGACDGEVRLWDLSTRLCLFSSTLHKGFVQGICTTPSGSNFVTVGQDKTIRVSRLDDEYIAAPGAEREEVRRPWPPPSSSNATLYWPSPPCPPLKEKDHDCFSPIEMWISSPFQRNAPTCWFHARGDDPSPLTDLPNDSLHISCSPRLRQ